LARNDHGGAVTACLLSGVARQSGWDSRSREHFRRGNAIPILIVALQARMHVWFDVILACPTQRFPGENLKH
jgi:hypothetical protein